MKMIVSILTVICVVFCKVSGQNNKYYSNADTIIFPDSVNPFQSPRITAVPKSRSLDEVDNLLQKSLLLAKEMNKLDSLNDVFDLVSGIPESEETSFGIRMGGERSSAIKPKPAKCMVELQPVSLVPENHDPSTVYIPSCTRIKRCGGCCNHSLLSCQPVRNTTETRNFEVLISQIDVNGKLKYAGKKVIPLEEHTQCECGCKIKPEHCSRGQFYSDSECRCICKNNDEEEKCKSNHDMKLWDPDTCSCACRYQSECSSGLFFNLNTCRCEKRGYSVQEWYENEKRVDYSLRRTNQREHPIIITLDASDPRRKHKDEPNR